MCGIAGYSRSERSALDAHEAARVLIASVADRGADAAGSAWRAADGTVLVDKQPGGALGFLERLDVPADLTQILLHVRDHTKGRPSLPANNHPIRHGSIVGVHNGRIENDEQIFRRLRCGRAEPGMTVDSEAIFAALHWVGDRSESLESLRGALAVGWFDDREPERIFLARGYGRPLWIASTADERDIVWASTLEALEITEEFLGVRLHKRPVRPGTILEIQDGRIVRRSSFRPDASAVWLENPVASPAERDACLAHLDTRIA
jgi:glucosamine 6-phosphate synthetase-like amidotransferase/phosphosugar isomerase protein